MAITDIKEFAHLTDADIDELGRELDRIRRDVEESRGASDARYVHNVIRLQRALEIGGRALLFGSRYRPVWLVGTGMLAVAKIVENMELGHNIVHGQWDWMNDPEIHSTTWEWDQTGPSSHWKRAHNYSHHTYTNVVGMDEDVQFGIIRMTRDVPWQPINLAQPLANALLAATFEWGIALHDWKITRQAEIDRGATDVSDIDREFARKATRQVVKDFVLFPALTGPAWRSTMSANAAANVIRNVWAHAVIFCGHFPDGAEKFTVEEHARETKAQWYLRQMLGSANISGGRVMDFMTGNLSFQIEHHLFPDLPSNRLREVSVRVRALCDKYDLPYTTGPLSRQYLLSMRTVLKLSLPDRFLRATSDDAPETSSERKFRALTRVGAAAQTDAAVDPVTGRRAGLRSALRRLRGR
ncbi:fatty acid desaturase family protein [Rhodococcus gannanensis]|uniref:Fatty acid desaturase family protein n=1 Tax=Rhodococcus gannanensis TaxID=1960308 RepID=A0ABW4P5P0_9NOCA